MDPKEVVRRLAPHVVQEIDTGWYPVSGEVPQTNGRVVVRWSGGAPRVELDRIPVWLVERDGEGRWLSRRESLMLDRAAREAGRAANRARQAQRDADRAAVIEAIRAGRAVHYEDGQEWGTLAVPVPAQSRHVVGSCCAPNKFEVIWAVASARGLYRALTGGTAGDQNWSCWLAEVTNPPAPVRPLPRRQRRDPVAFDLAAG